LRLLTKARDDLFLQKIEINDLYIYVLYPFYELIFRDYAVFHLTDH